MDKPKHDSLGDRMKAYENATRHALPAKAYTILRVDGRAFHTWTRGLKQPYDQDFMHCMDMAAIRLCEEISGTQFAYVQSDEISVLAVDFLNADTQAWFDGLIQKWASVAASIATAAFNDAVGARQSRFGKRLLATFDARVFITPATTFVNKQEQLEVVPAYVEAENYFVWRQQDAIRNSVAMLAQALASPKQLHGKKHAEQLEIVRAAGDDWARHPASFKSGRVIRRSGVAEWGSDIGEQPYDASYVIGNWFVDADTPVFTEDRAYLQALVQRKGSE